MSTNSPWEIEATNSGGSGEAPPEGNHPAVLVGLIDLGTHTENYQGKTYDARKALLCWELVAEKKGDGTPFVVSQSYSMMSKLSKKSGLRLMLEGWRGKPFADGEGLDLSSILGKSCLINIGHAVSAKGNTFAKILGISPTIRGMTVPRPTHTPFEWHIGSGPMSFPDWVPWVYGQSVEDIVTDSHEMGGGGKGRSESASPVGAGAGMDASNGSGDHLRSEGSDDDIPF